MDLRNLKKITIKFEKVMQECIENLINNEKVLNLRLDKISKQVNNHNFILKETVDRNSKFYVMLNEKNEEKETENEGDKSEINDESDENEYDYSNKSNEKYEINNLINKGNDTRMIETKEEYLEVNLEENKEKSNEKHIKYEEESKSLNKDDEIDKDSKEEKIKTKSSKKNISKVLKSSNQIKITKSKTNLNKENEILTYLNKTLKSLKTAKSITKIEKKDEISIFPIENHEKILENKENLQNEYDFIYKSKFNEIINEVKVLKNELNTQFNMINSMFLLKKNEISLSSSSSSLEINNILLKIEVLQDSIKEVNQYSQIKHQEVKIESEETQKQLRKIEEKLREYENLIEKQRQEVINSISLDKQILKKEVNDDIQKLRYDLNKYSTEVSSIKDGEFMSKLLLKSSEISQIQYQIEFNKQDIKRLYDLYDPIMIERSQIRKEVDDNKRKSIINLKTRNSSGIDVDVEKPKLIQKEKEKENDEETKFEMGNSFQSPTKIGHFLKKLKEIEKKQQETVSIMKYEELKEKYESLSNILLTFPNRNELEEVKKNMNKMIMTTSQLREDMTIYVINNKLQDEVLQLKKKIELVSASLTKFKNEEMENRQSKEIDLSKYVEVSALKEMKERIRLDFEKVYRKFIEMNDKYEEELKEKTKLHVSIDDIRKNISLLNENVMKLTNKTRNYVDIKEYKQKNIYYDEQINRLTDSYMRYLEKGETWILAKNKLHLTSCASCEKVINNQSMKEKEKCYNTIYELKNKNEENYNPNGNGYSKKLKSIDISKLIRTNKESESKVLNQEKEEKENKISSIENGIHNDNKNMKYEDEEGKYKNISKIYRLSKIKDKSGREYRNNHNISSIL